MSSRALGKRSAGDYGEYYGIKRDHIVTAQLVVEASTIISDKRPHSAIAAPPSLYPVYLLFQTQYKLLILAQETLERACYEFTVTAMIGLIDSEGWDCAEALELDIWTRKMEPREDKFSNEAIADLGKSFGDLLDSVVQIRHTVPGLNAELLAFEKICTA